MSLAAAPSIHATSVLCPRCHLGEQRLASLEPNGAQCIPQCLTMAINLRHVFSRRPLTEITPLSGNISLPCIQNELVLARFARRVSKKPCKPLFGNTHSENLARKGPFFSPEASKSYIVCISCHPVSPNRAKSPAPDRLHLQSPEQSALPPTSHPHKHKKRRPNRVAFQFWHRSEKPTEGNRG